MDYQKIPPSGRKGFSNQYMKVLLDMLNKERGWCQQEIARWGSCEWKCHKDRDISEIYVPQQTDVGSDKETLYTCLSVHYIMLSVTWSKRGSQSKNVQENRRNYYIHTEYWLRVVAFHTGYCWTRVPKMLQTSIETPRTQRALDNVVGRPVHRKGTVWIDDKVLHDHAIWIL